MEGDLSFSDEIVLSGHELNFKYDFINDEARREVLGTMVDCQNRGMGWISSVITMPHGRTLAAVFPLRYTAMMDWNRDPSAIPWGKKNGRFCENRWKRTARQDRANAEWLLCTAGLERGESPPELKGGTKRLPVDAVSFTDEITECDGKLNFYIPTYFDPDAVFGTHVCTDANDDWVDVYAGFDWKTGRMDSALTVRLCCTDGHEFEFSYRLSPRNRSSCGKDGRLLPPAEWSKLGGSKGRFAANAGRRRNGDPDVGSTIRQPLPLPTVFRPVFYW